MRMFTKMDEINKRYEISTMVRLLVDFDDTSKQAFINTCKELEQNPDVTDDTLYSWFLAEKETLDRKRGADSNNLI